MKAILVIDIPNGVSLDEWYAVNVVIARLKAPEEELIHCIPYDESKTFKFVPLRPLPQNVKAGDERFWKLKDGCIAKEHIHYEFANGWNACLNEITGENE